MSLILLVLIYSCKEEDVTNDFTVRIVSPKDSTIVYDTVSIIFQVDNNLNIVRTESYIDFELYEGYDAVPSNILFSTNKLQENGVHNFFLKIYTKEGNTYNSNVIALKINKLSKPIVNVKFISKNSAELMWSDNNDSEDGYLIRRKEGNNEFIQIGNLAKNSTSFKDNSIDTINSYTYLVEPYSGQFSLSSDSLKIKFILTKYLSFNNYAVPEDINGEISLSPDCKKIVLTNYQDDNFTVINTNNGTQNSLSQIGGSKGLDISNSGKFFITGQGANSSGLRIWDLENLSLIKQIDTGISASWEIIINKSDEQIIVGGEPIIILDATDGSLIRTFNEDRAFSHALAYSKDETTLLTGSNDNLVKLYNTSTGDIIKSYTGHTGHISSVCFNSDESQIISGSHEENSVIIWDKSTGNNIRTIYRNSPTMSIFSDANGNYIIASSNGTITLLDQEESIIQEFGEQGNLNDVDYNSTYDIIASYYNNKVILYKKIGHWEKI